MSGLREIDYVLQNLDWMRAERIWPNGLRYLWTDAFGLVLLVSLYEALSEERFLNQAEWLVAEVNRVLGRARGIRIGEEPDRDGQYFHYLAMWLFALSVLGRYRPSYRDQGIALARQIHDPFVVPGRGVIWKMQEDLSGPYPGYGFGALDAFTREELWCAMRDLQAAQKFNVILVTHDLRESVFLADTVYVMSKSPGRIVVKRDIDLPRPRDLEVTYTPQFIDIVHELRGHIGAIRKT